MDKIIDIFIDIIFAIILTFGTSYSVIKIHNFVKKETISQISNGLSSTEKLSNALTDKMQ